MARIQVRDGHYDEDEVQDYANRKGFQRSRAYAELIDDGVMIHAIEREHGDEMEAFGDRNHLNRFGTVKRLIELGLEAADD